MRKGNRGFTLVEVTIILLVLFILAAILLPMAERFIDMARLARVREDIGAIASVIEVFKVDTCRRWFTLDARVVGTAPNTTNPSNNKNDSNVVDMLIGDGFIPVNADLGSADWAEPFNGGSLVVDTIENHLAAGVSKAPFGNKYPTPDLFPGGTGYSGLPGGMGIDIPNPFRCGFRGAYIQTPVQADPWGNRYAVNVRYLSYVDSSVVGQNSDTYVLSAGPNGVAETPFKTGSSTGVVARGDDQIAVVSGSGAKL